MKKIAVLIVSVFVCGLILFAFVPGLIGATVETEINENDGAGWARFNYKEGPAIYDIRITTGADSVTVRAGTTQYGPLSENTILYADSNATIYLYSGVIYLDNNGAGQLLGSDISIKRTASAFRIADNENVYTFDAPAWAYIPIRGGDYASFDNSVILDHLNGSILASCDAGYIANATYTTVHYNMGSPAVLIRLIPLMFLIGLAVYFINKVNNRDKTDYNGGWKK